MDPHILIPTDGVALPALCADYSWLHDGAPETVAARTPAPLASWMSE